MSTKDTRTSRIPLARRLRRAFKWTAGAGVAVAAVYWFAWAPTGVVEHRLGRSGIAAEVMGTGALEARTRTTISTKISGRIEEVLVDEGDRVTAGALLVRLDDAEFRRQVEITEAGVAAARAAVDRLLADKARAEAVALQAGRDRERAASLYASDAASYIELDKATEALHVAEAELARANAAILEGRKQLAAAEKTESFHRARLADTRIVAPFDGLIVRRDREPGDVVVPGSAILSLVATGEIWVSAWVDETAMAALEAGQPSRVVFRSEPDQAYPGSVVRLGREVDRETREFLVDVRVLELPANWAIGQRAEVYIETARKPEVPVLPVRYLSWRDGKPGTFVHQNGRADWRRIRIGLQSREAVEIVEGLQPGEGVVAPARSGGLLKDGQRIKAL